MAPFEAMGYAPPLDNATLLTSEVRWVKPVARASGTNNCGIIMNAVLRLEGHWDADLRTPNADGLKSVLHYLEQNLNATSFGRMRSAPDLGVVTQGVCHGRVQYVLFMDAGVWRVLAEAAAYSPMREKVLGGFDGVGLYPDVPHLGLFVPFHLRYMQYLDPTLW